MAGIEFDKATRGELAHMLRDYLKRECDAEIGGMDAEFLLDFVTENVWPGEIRDERVVDLAMTPMAATPPEEVVARAEQARANAGSLPAPPPAPVAPQVVVPQPIPAPPPAQMPLPQPLPPPQGFPAPQGFPVPQALPPQPLTGTGPVFPPQVPAPAFQAPLQNAPAQGIPSLGVP